MYPFTSNGFTYCTEGVSSQSETKAWEVSYPIFGSHRMNLHEKIERDEKFQLNFLFIRYHKSRRHKSPEGKTKKDKWERDKSKAGEISEVLLDTNQNRPSYETISFRWCKVILQAIYPYMRRGFSSGRTLDSYVRNRLFHPIPGVSLELPRPHWVPVHWSRGKQALGSHCRKSTHLHMYCAFPWPLTGQRRFSSKEVEKVLS